MYNKMKQFCLRTAAVMMLVFALSFQSFAASAKIAFSDPSTQAGSEFDVRMKFTSTSGDTLGNTDVMLAYDATALEFLGGSDNASGGSGAIRVTSGMEGKTEIVTNLKFRALKAGTTQITVSSWEGYDADGQTLTMDKQGSSTIQITAGEQTYSSDAALQSLQISPGTLEPAFSPEVENYTATVGLDTERLTVGAIANSDKAVVSVEGAEGLQPGENTVICRVTAEDGTTVRTYTVVVNKAEGGENMETNAGDTEQTVTPADVLVHLEAGRTPASIGITAIPSVDNTFATPINCRPFEWGADIVTHSTTKYMDGHAMCVGGCIVDSGNFDWEAHADKFPGLTTPDESYHGVIYTKKFGKGAYITKATAQLMRDMGSIQSPQNAFLLNIGLETLHLRMPRHCENALKVAQYLQNREDVAWVKYPGLKGDRYYELAQKYMPNGTCGVISFGLRGGRAAAAEFMDKLKLAAIVTHVADARTSVLHPASHTHRQLNDEQLVEAGVDPSLIRFSVGIEAAEDIIADLEQALA